MDIYLLHWFCNDDHFLWLSYINLTNSTNFCSGRGCKNVLVAKISRGTYFDILYLNGVNRDHETEKVEDNFKGKL